MFGELLPLLLLYTNQTPPTHTRSNVLYSLLLHNKMLKRWLNPLNIWNPANCIPHYTPLLSFFGHTLLLFRSKEFIDNVHKIFYVSCTSQSLCPVWCESRVKGQSFKFNVLCYPNKKFFFSCFVCLNRATIIVSTGHTLWFSRSSHLLLRVKLLSSVVHTFMKFTN